MDISSNDIHAQGVTAIGEMLKVSIACSHAHTRCAPAPAHSLVAPPKPSARPVCRQVNHTIQELNMANNFAREQVRDIAAGLAANRGLTRLNLNVNQIDVRLPAPPWRPPFCQVTVWPTFAVQDAGARTLQTALVHNNTLRELTGFNNKVLDKDLRKWLKNARRW